MGNILSKGTTFSEGSTVTATNLNEHVDKADFVAGSGNTTDDASLEVHSAGYLQVKDGGITSAKLASDALTGGGEGGSTVIVNNNNFTSNSISGDKLVNQSVTASQIANGTITADKLDSSVAASIGGVTEAVHTPTFTAGASHMRGVGSPDTNQCGYSRVGRICYLGFDLRWTGSASISHTQAVLTMTLPLNAELGNNLGLSHDIHKMWSCPVSGYITDTSTTAGTASDPHLVRQGVPLIGVITVTNELRFHINSWEGGILQRLQGSIAYRIADTIT